MIRKIKVNKYGSLEECFAAFLGKDKIDDKDRAGFWVGNDGRSSYRVNIGKWLATTQRKAWGWAEYKTRSIHLWISKDCHPREAMRLISHEIGHLCRPRPGGTKEERKACRYGAVTEMSFDIAKQFINNI